MEINITRFFNEACPKDYSASMAEIGHDAGTITWSAAKADAPDWHMLDNADKLEVMRQWALSSGAWSADEIAAWDDIKLNALFIQLVAGDIRECFEWDCEDVWANYAELSEAGTVPSSIFRDDDGQIWFSLED